MAQVTVFISGRSYSLDCDDGQEEHLQRLGEHLDNRIRELQSSSRIQNDLELLVITGILLSDDLSDAIAEITELKKQVVSLEGHVKRASNPAFATQTIYSLDTSQIAVRLEAMAGRMERLAETVQDN